MALTDQGLFVRRFPEVLADIESSLTENIQTNLVFDNDTVLGHWNSIVSSSISDVESLVEALYDSMDRDKAEEEQLDRLLFWLGLRRQTAVATTGVQYFVGTEGTLVSAGSIVRNPSTGDNYRVVASVNISSVNCIECFFDVDPVRDSEVYTVNVNGNSFMITSGVGATADSIIDALVIEINGFASKTWTASNEDSMLRVSTDDVNFINVTAISFLIPRTTTSPGVILADETGPIRAPALAVNEIGTSTSGWTATFNPLELTVGRNRETDVEFRTRSVQTSQIGGSSTIPANLAALFNVPGVTSATLFENAAKGEDAAGRPSNSYEMVILGGSDEDIATALLGEKPAGIELVGNTSFTVEDSGGQPRVMLWSRPIPVYLAIVCDYTLYTEEPLPVNANLLIRQAMVDAGNSLQSGEDVIPDRFFGPIYNAVTGLGKITVRLEVIPSPGTPPINPQDVVIPVLSSEVATFNLIDATANQV